jgi:hypothetical protein
LDGAQVTSEVCVHHHGQVLLQMRSSWIHLPAQAWMFGWILVFGR